MDSALDSMDSPGLGHVALQTGMGCAEPGSVFNPGDVILVGLALFSNLARPRWLTTFLKQVETRICSEIGKNILRRARE